jgi:hypothetical protein
MEGTIYALKGSSEWCDIHASLKKGEGRFGWSHLETADLRQLKQRIEKDGWDSLSDEEKDCYQSFLLDFKEGDYVVYINVPQWGKCTVARVTGPYQWRFEDGGFNHRFPVDPASVYVFDRNDAIVHPALRSRLKLQGRWWRIYLQSEFEALLKSLKEGIRPTLRTPEVNLRLLSNEIQPFLSSITERIHHTHPNYDLEALFAEVFRKIPRVVDVRRQGGAGDHGADILVTFEAGLPIPGLENQYTVVVQVKSFEGEHWDTRAVEDIQRAFEHYPEASMGLIISTASASTTALDNALDKLKEESGKPVALLIGPDVAAFLLRFGAKLLA